MRLSFLGCALLSGVLVSSSACTNQNHESIEAMNAGIQAFNSGAKSTAVAQMEKALTLDPENHFAAWNLSLVYLKGREWDKMVDSLTTAVKYAPEQAMYHYQLGHGYYELGKAEMAIQSLEKAISLNERLYKAHYFLGKAFAAEGEAQKAAGAWSESARLNPNFGKSFVELGRLYMDWDFLEEAIKVYVQGAQYARDAEDRTEIFYHLGLLYKSQDKKDDAIEAFKKAVAERKDNLQAKKELGIIYANAGDLDEAKMHLEEFIKAGGGGDMFALQQANRYMMEVQKKIYEKEDKGGDEGE